MLANKNCGQARERSRSSRSERGAGVPQACVHGSKRRGQSLSDQALVRGMRRLSTRLPTQSVDKRRGARDMRFVVSMTKRERHFAGRRSCAACRVPHSKQRGQSLSDQALDRGMRRLSTCLPTQSVDKPAR
ncbi:hypothetical protein [Burkholderia sp. BCC1977]|uniref:hypothetical protein n=1 Tax=Burkholderia sp. BCC1977 TaxID=2817440 RepID=UPI002ABD5CAC|nr:hypothetical protein [Burkholderia sp. BCC1977]